MVLDSISWASLVGTLKGLVGLTTSSTTAGSVLTVVSDAVGSVLMISARVDSCESELSLAGLVGELTGEIWTETWGLE